MDEATAYKMAEHCLKEDTQSQTYYRLLDRIKTQLIIAYRMGVVTDREDEMAREHFNCSCGTCIAKREAELDT